MNENTVTSSKLLVELLSGDGLNEAIAILIVIAGLVASAVLPVSRCPAPPSCT